MFFQYHLTWKMPPLPYLANLASWIPTTVTSRSDNCNELYDYISLFYSKCLGGWLKKSSWHRMLQAQLLLGILQSFS